MRWQDFYEIPRLEIYPPDLDYGITWWTVDISDLKYDMEKNPGSVKHILEKYHPIEKMGFDYGSGAEYDTEEQAIKAAEEIAKLFNLNLID